jgi:tRNA nucleotidyltransferase/poly(A) polymerase
MDMANEMPDPKVWDQFLKERFGPQGGRTLVPNTNIESRERFPKVEVFTLFKNDKRFLQATIREFHEWKGKQEKPSSAKRTLMDLHIPGDLQKIHEEMKEAGHETYIVGGAVRDTLLGEEPKDYDLATGATPDKVIKILSKDPKNKIDLTGKSFGVVRVNTPEGNEYEIATYRKDVGKGRRPDAVEFTTIEEDVKRRDLTINALFYDMDSGEMVDYVGGEEDLNNGVVRTVGDPHERFDEDKLRVLRAVRFVGRLDGTLDPTTADAIKENSDLAGVSEERVRDEFFKGITSSKSPKRYLELMNDLGLLKGAFPGLTITEDFKDVPHGPMQLAILLQGNNPKKIAQVLKKMKYTNKEIQHTLYMLKLRGLDAESAPGLRKAQKAADIAPETLVSGAKHLGHPDQKELGTFLRYLQEPPAATGEQMAEKGLTGKAIGDAIREAEVKKYRELRGST